MYTPDNWVILKITIKKETLYKILAGWSGGYLDGDAWRMNSGITSFIQEGDYISFNGYSGSIYKCYKGSEKLRMNNAGIYTQLTEAHPDRVSLIKFKDFKKEFKEEL